MQTNSVDYEPEVGRIICYTAGWHAVIVGVTSTGPGDDDPVVELMFVKNIFANQRNEFKHWRTEVLPALELPPRTFWINIESLGREVDQRMAKLLSSLNELKLQVEKVKK